MWNGAGKVAKNFLWRLEQEGMRSTTAFNCFKNTKNKNYEFDEHEMWKKAEETRDKYLLKCNTFTTTCRITGHAMETQEEFERYSQEFPGCAVFTNCAPA